MWILVEIFKAQVINVKKREELVSESLYKVHINVEFIFPVG